MVMPKFRTTSVPAPVGGLNARDNIADMPLTDAVILNNWWPYPSYVGVRKGYINHVTGFTNPVETLVEYLPVDGVSTLFAASGTSIYDVTAAGSLGAAVQTGLTNARFQDVQITTAGGNFLYLFNGADAPRLWNGTSWTSVTGVSTPSITGITTSEIIHGCVYKSRLYLVTIDSLSVYYLPPVSIGGAVGELDVGTVFRMGGYVTAVYPWTIDAGNGPDDHLVVISSMGEVAVYRGSDPTSVTDWSIVGVFVLGKPIGRRCGIKYGGDLIINTAEGVYPLSRGLLSSTIDRRVALTDKIQNLVSEDTQSYGSQFGWQLCLYPDANMLLLNVPANSRRYQYAQNTITGSWAKFTGYAGNVWLNASTGLYFGTNTQISKAWVGNVDNSTPIQADALPAFSYFGSKSFNKYFTMVRPYIQTTGTPSILYSLNTNYLPQDPTGTLSFTPPTGMVWGSMVWGSMVWGGTLAQFTNWNTVGAVSNSASIRIKCQNNGASVRWSNTDYVWQPSGGVL
jgi:hypothetical protein